MAGQDRSGKKQPPAVVRKCVAVEEAKLARARKLLSTASDADVLRRALDFLLAHYESAPKEEE